MPFVQTADGNVVDGHRASAIRSHLRALLVQLAAGSRVLPTTWGKSGKEERDYVYLQLETAFPELRLCELHWKAQNIVTDVYTKWYSKHIGAQTSRIKIEDNDNDEDEDRLDNPSRSSSPTFSSERRSSPSLPPRKRAKLSQKVPTSLSPANIPPLLQDSATSLKDSTGDGDDNENGIAVVSGPHEDDGGHTGASGADDDVEVAHSAQVRSSSNFPFSDAHNPSVYRVPQAALILCKPNIVSMLLSLLTYFYSSARACTAHLRTRCRLLV